jgi:hypothetical protein
VVDGGLGSGAAGVGLAEREVRSLQGVGGLLGSALSRVQTVHDSHLPLYLVYFRWEQKKQVRPHHLNVIMFASRALPLRQSREWNDSMQKWNLYHLEEQWKVVRVHLRWKQKKRFGPPTAKKMRNALPRS